MNRPSRPDVLDLQVQQQSSTSTRARSRSIGSVDKPLSSNGSSIYSLANSLLTSVSPEPAYIAASAATGIVTGNHEDFLQDEADTGHPIPTIPVTPASLKLINQFLDFLLYSFLSTAKSTTLKALRPAISEILRSRLAKEAIFGADQELSSYLGGGDDGDVDFDGVNPQENSADWDLDVIWKRTRLRCMVYSSLGDIEEDDEEVYSGYGNLEGIVGSQQYEQNSMVPGVVSPAVAIWLTSVLEFMGEQTLLLAGHAAINRFTQRVAAAENENHRFGTQNIAERDRPMVEELDTEKVALNSSLGRLWRQWRKRVRGRGSSFSMPVHHGALLQRLERTASRMSSSSTIASAQTEFRNPQAEISEYCEVLQEVVIAMNEGVELEAEEVGDQSKESDKKGLLTPIVEATSTINEEFPGKVATPSGPYVDGGYLSPERAEDNRKRRPQSLALLPWTTTEAPFTLQSSSMRRPRSLPAITRSDFPDPVARVEIEDRGIDPEDIPELFVPTEERPNLAIRTFQEKLTSERLVLLEQPSPAQERSEKLAVGKVSGGAESRILNQTKSSAAAPTEPASLRNAGHTGAIGLARTSDILVPPPASRSPSLHKPDENCVSDEAAKKSTDQEAHAVSTPSTIDQQRYERLLQSSRRPSELDEMRASGRVSTFEEQRAADRRPSATNLREFLDNAVASDDDSSTATSQKDFKGGRLTPGGTNYIAADYFAHSKQTSTSSKYSQHSQLSDRKLGQLTLIQPPGSTTSLPIIGNNMRVWTPPQTPNKSRRSSSFGKIQRPVTAHSGTSQSSTKLKSLILWPMESGKAKAPESDDDSRSSLNSDRSSSKFASLDEKERSFEELISSGDTIHCTITPDPLRRMEAKETPRTATSTLADFLRNTGPDSKEVRAAPPSRSSNSSRPSTARAIPIIPKEPSVENIESLSHLLRTTSATPIETRPQTPVPSHPSPSLMVYSPNQLRPGVGSGTVSPIATNFGSKPLSPGAIPGIPAVLRQQRSSSHDSGPRNRRVARNASGFTTSDSTSALADFFRNTTPPIEGQAIQRRISRSVAPFRNTLDSDQFELPPGPEHRAERVTPAEMPLNDHALLPSNTAPPESYQSSFSSSTALLRGNSKKLHDYGAVNSALEPKRKQTRVKDPYAIDMDELDDDDDMEALNLMIPKKMREEESLIDFLRNVPPPPRPPTPPDDSEAMKTVQKKNSSVSLISRFGRSGRKNSIASNADKFPIPHVPQVPGGYKHSPLPQDDMQGSEQRRPLFNSRMDTDSVGMAGNVRFGNRTTQARGAVQARGARLDKDNTDGMGDFLKFSEPPLSARAPNPKEDNGAMSKFKNFTFSRRSKRNEVAGLV